MEQKIKDQIIDIGEENGWKVDISETSNPNILEVTFSQYTNAGQDFYFEVELKNYNIEDFIKNLGDYYESYDPDAEAYLWLGPDGHGKNGAPYRMVDVLKDMKQAEAMVSDLFDAFTNANDAREFEFKT